MGDDRESRTVLASRMSDADLLVAFNNSDRNIETPATRALIAEIEWRGLGRPEGFTPLSEARSVSERTSRDEL